MGKYGNDGIGKRQAALGDVEERGFFSTNVGSVDSFSKAEHRPLFSGSFIQYSGFQDFLVEVDLILPTFSRQLQFLLSKHDYRGRN